MALSKEHMQALQESYTRKAYDEWIKYPKPADGEELFLMYFDKVPTYEDWLIEQESTNELFEHSFNELIKFFNERKEQIVIPTPSPKLLVADCENGLAYAMGENNAYCIRLENGIIIKIILDEYRR